LQWDKKLNILTEKPSKLLGVVGYGFNKIEA
jgi:hypothetical protein